MKTKQYKVQVGTQGNAVVSNYGYAAKESDGIILLFLDARGDTGRAYVDGTSYSYEQDPHLGVPELWLSTSDDDKVATVITFPELQGWNVFCANGGKTLSIALQKGRSFE
jgi:hypothetical protein